jgi:hypothetical protein
MGGKGYMGLMRHNGQQYYQDVTGYLMSIDGIMDDMSGSIESIMPVRRPYNAQAIRRLPDDLNTSDPAQTCSQCDTSSRLSQRYDPGTCPYCHEALT